MAPTPSSAPSASKSVARRRALPMVAALLAVADGGALTLTLPPYPRPAGAPPLNTQSMPAEKSSVNVTSMMAISITTWRDATSSLRIACSMIWYSAGVATIRIALLSLSATTCRLRTAPTPAAPATPPAFAWLVTLTAGAGVAVDDCAENDGGDTMEPAGVPGATVAAPGPDDVVEWPVNACCNSGPMCSARVF